MAEFEVEVNVDGNTINFSVEGENKAEAIHEAKQALFELISQLRDSDFSVFNEDGDEI